MDAGLSALLIALISGIFGVITARMNNKQKSMVQKIENQNLFVEKEKTLKHKLNEKEKERDEAMHEVMLLILDTNMNILKNQHSDLMDEKVFEKSEELKKRFATISESIDDLYKQYETVLDLTKTFQDEMNSKNNKSNKSG